MTTALHLVATRPQKGRTIPERSVVKQIRFNPPVVYFTDRSKAVVLVLVLLFVALWFILRGD